MLFAAALKSQYGGDAASVSVEMRFSERFWAMAVLWAVFQNKHKQNINMGAQKLLAIQSICSLKLSFFSSVRSLHVPSFKPPCKEWKTLKSMGEER